MRLFMNRARRIDLISRSISITACMMTYSVVNIYVAVALDVGGDLCKCEFRLSMNEDRDANAR